MLVNIAISCCPLRPVPEQTPIIANGHLEMECGNPDHWVPNREVSHFGIEERHELGKLLNEYGRIERRK